jgi:hypothetical protein
LKTTDDGGCFSVYVESTLVHHFFDISIGKLVAAVPSNTQKNNGWLEVPPLEGK